MVSPDAQERMQKSLGYVFNNPALLISALSHKSYVNESTGEHFGDNERLEFLGDAVLDLVVSDQLFTHYSRLDEGEMTRVRAEVVSEKNLAAVARSLSLGLYLLLGKGERLTGGDDKDSLLSDALEAIFGAVYQDGAFAAAQGVVLELLSTDIEQAVMRKSGLDYKTRLQEFVQARYRAVPEYVLVETTGPDHGRTYQMSVRFNGQEYGPGNGRTKKKAEQDVARLALRTLGE